MTDDQDFEYETVTWLHAATMDWSCVDCIKALNRWRHQIIYRRLDKNDPAIQKAQRPTWTWIEMMLVIATAREIISDKDAAMWATQPSYPLLDDADWVSIKDQLNERFKDSEAQVGERTAEATKNPVLKKAHKILCNRNTKALRSQTAKWPSFKAMEDEEREKLIARGQAEMQE